MSLKIKEAIKSKGYSMQDFADLLGITRDTLTRNINGNPTYKTLNTIAVALNINVTELFEPIEDDRLIALIDYRGKLHKASTLQELEELVERLKAEKK